MVILRPCQADDQQICLAVNPVAAQHYAQVKNRLPCPVANLHLCQADDQPPSRVECRLPSRVLTRRFHQVEYLLLFLALNHLCLPLRHQRSHQVINQQFFQPGFLHYRPALVRHTPLAGHRPFYQAVMNPLFFLRGFLRFYPVVNLHRFLVDDQQVYLAISRIVGRHRFQAGSPPPHNPRYD